MEPSLWSWRGDPMRTSRCALLWSLRQKMSSDASACILAFYHNVIPKKYVFFK